MRENTAKKLSTEVVPLQKSFLEVQFPVSKISKESYKERKAGAGQTLTGLGKWWGRKPLILVRSIIIGTLMPASIDPKRDREIFLKILTMDNEGLWCRKKSKLPIEMIYAKIGVLERNRYFAANSTTKQPKWLDELPPAKKEEAEKKAFECLSYVRYHNCRSDPTFMVSKKNFVSFFSLVS